LAPNEVHAKMLLYPLIFFQNKAASELDEVYKSNMYDGGLSKGGKLTLPPMNTANGKRW